MLGCFHMPTAVDGVGRGMGGWRLRWYETGQRRDMEDEEIGWETPTAVSKGEPGQRLPMLGRQ